MISFAAFAARLTRTATFPAYRRYMRSLEDPAGAQEHLLRQLIGDTSASQYGKEFGLRADDTTDTFQEKIPVAGYEHYRPWIERAIFNNELGILSPHPIVRVETTSGSSAGVKWIPYTRPMMGTFRRMFTLWAHDLLRHLYQAKTGRLFLCVTGGRPNDGALPHRLIGDDRDYLGQRWRYLLSRFVVAPQFAGHEDPLDMLAETLASEPKLEVMSFWSPSLLLAALDHLGINQSEETCRLWPRLQLISCWTAASSALFIKRLRALFPTVHFQGKGLLATEAALTIPLEPANGCVPLLNDVYLEFLSEDEACHRVHELQEGAEYEVLISNRAGLLRYRLGDRVRVTGFFKKTPLLDFIGRAGIISDMVGEKLTLEFIERQLSPAIRSYFCLMPVDKGYELWLDAKHLAQLDQLEPILCRNFHYARALRLEQLTPTSIHVADGLAEQIRRCLEGHRASSASRAFKPPLLIPDREKARRVSQALRRKSQENTE